MVARGHTILLRRDHAIFKMSELLHAMVVRWTGSLGLLRVDVNPFALQALVDYAACRAAASSGVDREAETLQVQLAEQILGDATLLWAVHVLQMKLGVEVEAPPPARIRWDIDKRLLFTLGLGHWKVDMDAAWALGTAVALLSLLAKAHDYPSVRVEIKEGHGDGPPKLQAEQVVLTLGTTRLVLVLGETSKNWQTRSSTFSYFQETWIWACLDDVDEKSPLRPFVQQVLAYLARFEVPANRHF